jgi:hypothetical protein
VDHLEPLLVPQTFGSRTVLWRRMRRLYLSRHLARPAAQDAVPQPGRGNRPDLYALGNGGAAELRALAVEMPRTDFQQDADELKPLSLAHMIATTEAVAHFLRTFPNHPRLELTRVFRDGELRETVPYFNGRTTVAGSVVPDATLVLREENGRRLALLFEVDRGTMPGRRTDPTQSDFLQKCRRYLAWWQDGARVARTLAVHDFYVLTITKTAERAAGLRRIAASSHPEPHIFWFTDRDELLSHDPLSDEIWTTAAGETGSLF